MENSRKDLNILSTSSAEMQFLQRVKECQHQIDYMQKLFFDLQNVQENRPQLEGSCVSLNEFDQSLNKNNISSNNISDFQLLMQEHEAKINSKNNLFQENYFESSQKKIPETAQLESINSDDNSPLTFMIQVPNSLLHVLKRKVSGDHSSDFSSESECSSTKTSKKQKKAGLITVLQRVFKRKKNNNLLATTENKISQNVELLQLYGEKNSESISISTQTSSETCTNYTSTTEDTCVKKGTNNNDKSTHTEIDSKSKNLKNSQTMTFPIMLNLNEESIAMAKPNFTMHQEKTPQTNSNEYSNSIKVTNKCSLQSTKRSSDTNYKETLTEKSKEYSKKEQLQPTELLLESLIKALLKTTEKLDHLESIAALLESLDLKEFKTTKSDQGCKAFKTRKRKDSAVSPHLFQNDSVNDFKSAEKKIQKIPKRQSSKLSICSSSDSVSSCDEFKKSPLVLKPSQIQRYRRSCHSPSRLSYLICQSERDIDKKVHSKK